MEYVSLGRGDGITMSFTWNGTPKPIGGGFVGTSPSLELALYTTCLLTRPNAKCHVTLGGQDVYIQTWVEKSSLDRATHRGRIDCQDKDTALYVQCLFPIY